MKEKNKRIDFTEFLQVAESELVGDKASLLTGKDCVACDEKSGVTERADEEKINLVVSLIPFGKENAIERDRLSALLNTNDRTARQLVAMARAAGHVIINAQDGRGYYRTDDLDEIERQYKQDTARAMSVLVRRKALRQILKAAGRSV